MSFNQLPDELIAQIASHCSVMDTPHLLQTQKRTLKILKSYNMDKPTFKEVEFIIKQTEFGYKLVSRGQQKDGRIHREVRNCEEEFDWSVVADFLNKCHTSLLRINGNGYINLDEKAANLLTTIVKNTKIRKLFLSSLAVNLNPDQLVKFSENFKSLSLGDMAIMEENLCDEVFTRLVSTVEIEEFFSRYTTGLGWANRHSRVNISDISLEAIISNRSCYYFSFDMFTMFTIQGIRRFIEDAVMNGRRFYINFGELSSNQVADANNWVTISQRHQPPLHYRMQSSYSTYQINYKTSIAIFRITPWL